MPLIPNVPKCDVCGKIKIDSNHWWLLYPLEVCGVYTLYAYYESHLRKPELMYLCSESCLAKAEGELRLKSLNEGRTNAKEQTARELEVPQLQAEGPQLETEV